MSAKGPLKLDQQLCYALYSASLAVGRVYKPLLDGLEITYPQYLVMSVLWEEDAQTIGTVAERLALDSSTITPLVKRLEASGFLVRTRNPRDERQVLVGLTDKGRALQARTGCLSEALLASSGWKVEQIIALNEQVKALRQALAGAYAAQNSN